MKFIVKRSNCPRNYFGYYVIKKAIELESKA